MLLDRPCLLILAVEPLLVALGPVIVPKSSEGGVSRAVPQISYGRPAFIQNDMLRRMLAY